MHQKKTPIAVETTTSAPNSAIVSAPNSTCKMSLRQWRALHALQAGGWVTREAMDKIAGSSNSPDVIQQLRRKLGRDAIECERFEATDRDGHLCRPGRYRLTEKGRTQVAMLRIEGNREARHEL